MAEYHANRMEMALAVYMPTYNISAMLKYIDHTGNMGHTGVGLIQ